MKFVNSDMRGMINVHVQCAPVISILLVQQLLIILLLLANVPMAIYFSVVHQRGTIAVMSHLREVRTEHVIDNYTICLSCLVRPGYPVKLVSPVSSPLSLHTSTQPCARCHC